MPLPKWRSLIFWPGIQGRTGSDPNFLFQLLAPFSLSEDLGSGYSSQLLVSFALLLILLVLYEKSFPLRSYHSTLHSVYRTQIPFLVRRVNHLLRQFVCPNFCGSGTINNSVPHPHLLLHKTLESQRADPGCFNNLVPLPEPGMQEALVITGYGVTGVLFLFFFFFNSYCKFY